MESSGNIKQSGGGANARLQQDQSERLNYLKGLCVQKEIAELSTGTVENRGF